MRAGSLGGVESVPTLDGVDALTRALDWTRSHPLTSGRIIPVCLWGEMGVGKTQMVGQYTQRRRHGFRVYHPAHDASRREVLGQAFRDRDTNRTRFAVPEFLPSGAEVAALNPTGVLLIDELNRADTTVLAGLFELIGEGRISQSGYRLPDGWQVVCCANPQSSRYQVQPLDPALVDRMLHLRVGFDPDRWRDWAAREGLEEDVLRFVGRQPEVVFDGHGLADNGALPLATPRSLELFAALYEPRMPDDLLRMFAHGLLGEKAAQAFLEGPRGADRALTAEQVCLGLWRRYLPRWIAGEASEKVRITLENVLAFLETRPRDAATAGELAGMRLALTEPQREWFDAALTERAGPWFELVLRLTDADSPPAPGG